MNELNNILNNVNNVDKLNYMEAMVEVKECKALYVNLFSQITENKIKLRKKIKNKFIKLYLKWINDKDANIEYYLNIKNLHNPLTTAIINSKNKKLIESWDKYLKKYTRMVVLLLKFNYGLMYKNTF